MGNMCRRNAEVDSRRAHCRLTTRCTGRFADPKIADAVNDPDLAAVIKAWNRLPDAIKAGIVAIRGGRDELKFCEQDTRLSELTPSPHSEGWPLRGA